MVETCDADDLCKYKNFISPPEPMDTIKVYKYFIIHYIIQYDILSRIYRTLIV